MFLFVLTLFFWFIQGYCPEIRSKTLNNRTRGANREYLSGPAGPGSGFGRPGRDFLK